MVDLKSKEEILYFMRSGVLRISRSDLRFITNLQTIINTKKYVTSNQSNLLEKIILKYERQLAKHELSTNKLIALPWRIEILESSHSYTDAFITIDGKAIYFKSPYNKQFITDFKNHSSDLFKWNPELKRYEGEYSTTTLRTLATMAPKYFGIVNHCIETTRLLSIISQYDYGLCWEPTLVSVNGNLMVVALNQHLSDAIKDISLTTDVKTLATLASYGVKVHSTLLPTEHEVFASNYAPLVEVTEIGNLVVWLSELECDYVYISGGNSLSRIIKTLVTELNSKSIPHGIVTYREKPIDATQFKFPVIVRFTRTGNVDIEPKRIAKLITMVNSEPIDIK